MIRKYTEKYKKGNKVKIGTYIINYPIHATIDYTL